MKAGYKERLRLFQDMKREEVLAMGNLLTFREKVIFYSRYGIGTETNPMTLVKLANKFSVCPERIVQIEQKALRKIAHFVQGQLNGGNKP